MAIFVNSEYSEEDWMNDDDSLVISGTTREDLEAEEAKHKDGTTIVGSDNK